jgi:hypothetical protein
MNSTSAYASATVTDHLLREARTYGIAICRLARLAYTRPGPYASSLPDGRTAPIEPGTVVVALALGSWRYAIVERTTDKHVEFAFLTPTGIDTHQKTWITKSREILDPNYPQRKALQALHRSDSDEAAELAYVEAYCVQTAARDCTHSPWAAVTPLQHETRERSVVYWPRRLNELEALPPCEPLTRRIPNATERALHRQLTTPMRPTQRAALRLLLTFQEGLLFTEPTLTEHFLNEPDTQAPTVDFHRLAARLSDTEVTRDIKSRHGGLVYGVLKFVAELALPGDHAVGTLTGCSAPADLLTAALGEALGCPTRAGKS